MPAKPTADHEYERLNPGAHADRPQRDDKRPNDKRPNDKRRETRDKHDAALPGSQNADLRGAKRDRTFRGSTT